MNRRDFLRSLGAAGVLVPTARLAEGAERIAREISKDNLAVKAQKLAVYIGAEQEDKIKYVKDDKNMEYRVIRWSDGLQIHFGGYEISRICSTLSDGNLDGRLEFGLTTYEIIDALPDHIRELEPAENPRKGIIGLTYHDPERSVPSSDWGNQLFHAIYEHALDILLNSYE